MYANRGIFADSLIVVYEKKIEIFEEVVFVKDEELQLSQRLLESQMILIDKQDKNIKWLKLGVTVLGTAALFEFIMIIAP